MDENSNNSVATIRRPLNVRRPLQSLSVHPLQPSAQQQQPSFFHQYTKKLGPQKSSSANQNGMLENFSTSSSLKVVNDENRQVVRIIHPIPQSFSPFKKEEPKKKKKKRSLKVRHSSCISPVKDNSFVNILRDNDKEQRAKLEERRRSQSKSGQTHVDFVRELGIERQCLHVLMKIFSNLSGHDLTSLSCVSTVYNELIQVDRRSNDKRLKYLRKMRRLRTRVGTENWPIKPRRGPSSSILFSRTSLAGNGEKRLLHNIENVIPLQSLR